MRGETRADALHLQELLEHFVLFQLDPVGSLLELTALLLLLVENTQTSVAEDDLLSLGVDRQLITAIADERQLNARRGLAELHGQGVGIAQLDGQGVDGGVLREDDLQA